MFKRAWKGFFNQEHFKFLFLPVNWTINLPHNSVIGAASKII
jgi:hypothetical protein